MSLLLEREQEKEDDMPKKDPLDDLELFRDVAQKTKERLWQQGRIRSLPKGSIIIHAKEPLKTVFIQLAGKSIIYNLTHTGKRKIIFILGPGALLNEHVLDTHLASVFCETIEASKVFAVPASRFVALMEADFQLTRAVLTAQERKIWRMGHQLKNTMGSIYMEKKLAAKLWKLSRDFGKETPEGILIDIHLPITFLADLLGAPRETTSRLCKTLTDLELIRMERKKITILDPEKMSQFYKTGQIDGRSLQDP